MHLWTAFLLGFVGSLHCAAMCGPLVLFTPHVGRSTAGFVGSRLLYHAGRVTIYGVIGAIMGAAGQAFAFAGLQRWVAMAAGLALLLGLFLAARCKLNAPAWRAVVRLKTAFAVLLKRRTYASVFLLAEAPTSSGAGRPGRAVYLPSTFRSPIAQRAWRR